MKALILGLVFIVMCAQSSVAQETKTAVPTKSITSAEQEIITLSKNKWQWMADKNVDTLGVLFHDKAVFVHMGGSWGKEQELYIILEDQAIIRQYRDSGFTE